MTFCKAIMSAKWISNNKTAKGWLHEALFAGLLLKLQVKMVPAACWWMAVDFDGEFPSLIISSDISLCLVLNFKLDFAA